MALDRFAIGCRAGGAIWSAATGRRCAAFVGNKAATRRRTPKQAASPMPYTDVKTDLTIREVSKNEVEALLPLLLLAEPSESALRIATRRRGDAVRREYRN